jgi:hypothetical protein
MRLEVYGRDGRYLGEIRNQNRLITNRSKRNQRRASFTPYVRRAGVARYANYAGYVMYAGYEDFPSPQHSPRWLAQRARRASPAPSPPHPRRSARSARLDDPEVVSLAVFDDEETIDLQEKTRTGATGLEPATSGVTGWFEGHDD